jgi:hypothetical protein
MGQYSILDLIDEFKGVSPGFEFYIDWPNEGASFVRWQQSQNPFDGRGTVTSVVQSPANQLGCTAFGGLGDDANVNATLDGSTNFCWWWAIGTSVAWGAGIPAYQNSDTGGLDATRTRLWVR